MQRKMKTLFNELNKHVKQINQQWKMKTLFNELNKHVKQIN